MDKATMSHYQCIVCDFIYKPEKTDMNYDNKIVSFEDLPKNWKCPECGSAKKFFIQLNTENKNIKF